MKLLLLLTLLPALGSTCARGYDVWLDGRCFRQNYQTGVYYSEANIICNKDLAHLPSIKSQEDGDQFIQSLSHQFGYTFWLGLTCDGEKFLWADGSEANYTNFAGDYKCTKASIDSKYYFGNDKLWYESYNGQNNGAGANNVVCEANKRSASTCDNYDLLQSTDTCYLLQQQQTTWLNAESICQQQGSHLAVIHDQTVNDYLRRTAVAAGVLNGVHIGLKRNNFDNYTWADGSNVDYSNFEPDYPNAQRGDCVVMDTRNRPGQWVNAGCSNVPLPFVCTKPAFFPTNPQPAGCPTNAQYGPGDDIYSPSYPASPGSSVCDYLLLESDTSKRVQIEISFLEANKCCDSLTVYDGLYGSSVLATLTGYMTTSFNIVANSNAIRLHWNATSGANVRGFHAVMKSSVNKSG